MDIIKSKDMVDILCKMMYNTQVNQIYGGTNMSIMSMKVIRKIDKDLSDAREDCLKGVEVARRQVSRTVLNTLDGWDPILSTKERNEVLDYVKEEYGVIL